MFKLLLLLGLMFIQPVSVYGFDDFCLYGTCYDNPAKDLALELAGQVVAVDWDIVEALPLAGPGVGIGVDPTTERAYINGSAYGWHSWAMGGIDAGDQECGHLYARLLDVHPCSLFVHVPLEPTVYDLMIVKKAIMKAYRCQFKLTQAPLARKRILSVSSR